MFLFLFYLHVEPVFLPACLNKAIQITSVSSILPFLDNETWFEDNPKSSSIFEPF